jgi:hypothetical protein
LASDAARTDLLDPAGAPGERAAGAGSTGSSSRCTAYPPAHIRDPFIDGLLLMIAPAAFIYGSDQARYAREPLQAGIVQLLSRCCSRGNSAAPETPIVVVGMLCDALTDFSGAQLERADAEALLPLVQPLAALAGRHGSGDAAIRENDAMQE